MKINCSYCNSAMEATSETCPNCGSVNEKAAQYINQREKQIEYKKQLEFEAKNVRLTTTTYQKKALKIIKIVYGTIAILFVLFFVIAIVLSNKNQEKREQERQRQKQEQLAEEQRQKEEAEAEKKAYDDEVVEATGMNVVIQKDKYYSIEVTDAVAYELNYDHNPMDWGYDVTSDPHLHDVEHRVAIQIKVKNFQDKVTIYGKPTSYMGLYICDENDDNIVICGDSFLNGSSDDNYYGGGKMISSTNEFIDKYSKSLEKNQTMSWWVPVVVDENSEKVILHFDYNMTITIDNPCASKE